MKKLLLILLTCCFCSATLAQLDHTKLSTEIKKLSGEWINSFKTIKGAVLFENDQESVFRSRFKLSGSIDSTNLIRYVKDRQIWSFSADFDHPALTPSTLDSLITRIYYSFGEVKSTTTNTPWGKAYVPASKKGASEKLRCFYLLVYDHSKDPLNKTGRKFSLTVSDDDYFRAR
jgi:hypothetical protein